jgi:hypothetical protein
MKTSYLIIIFAILGLTTACKRKETFPDLAKQIEGKWNIYDALILSDASDSTYHYNPRDSAQVGLIRVRKIDALRVLILMSVTQKNGVIIFEGDYECELSRDFQNEGIILLHTYPGTGGGYHIKEKYLEISASGRKEGQYTGKTAWFLARR